MAFAPAGLPSDALSPSAALSARLAGLWWLVLAVGGPRESNTTTLELPNLAPRPEVAELVRRSQDGENEAFGLLYDRYADVVFRYVVYRVGNVSVAEDIVSETFLRALRRIGTFTWQGTDIGAWFVTIARNLIVDYSRSSRVRLEFPSDDVLAAADEPGGASPSPEDAVLTGLRNRLLL
nr:sigma factor [Micromonospora sp. DSM 115978]